MAANSRPSMRALPRRTSSSLPPSTKATTPIAFGCAWLLTGSSPSIPPVSRRRQKFPYDKELYRGRNRIERFFNKLKPFRGLATRYDKLAKTFTAALHLVAVFILLRNS